MSGQDEDDWTPQRSSSSNNEVGPMPFPFGEKANRGSNWNDPEMQALLILLKEEADTSPKDFHNAYRKGPIYRRISDRMKAIGFNRRPDQIQCKTKKWKSLYMNVLRQRHKGKRVTCRYFKDLMEIFGDTPDKLGASVAAEESDDIVEVELSHQAAIAANRETVDNPQPVVRESPDRSPQLQQPNTINRTAKRIVQRSLALQRLSQRADGFGITLSASDMSQPLYPAPEKADLVHFILLEASNDPSDDAWQSFLLERGLLKLQLLREEFNLTRIKIKIENHWVRLTEDDNGYIPLSFTPDSSFVIKGNRTLEIDTAETTQNRQTFNHIDNGGRS